MAALNIGDKAPHFALRTDRQDIFSMNENTGRPIVLYFYPRDDTEGCTIEAQEFTHLAAEFEKLGAVVVGISPDSVEDHCTFRDKYGLGITLVSDPDHHAINAYGVWGEKTTFGRKYMGLIRTTFLVAADGHIAEIWTVRRVKGHAAAVLAATRALVA